MVAMSPMHAVSIVGTSRRCHEYQLITVLFKRQIPEPAVLGCCSTSEASLSLSLSISLKLLSSYTGFYDRLLGANMQMEDVLLGEVTEQ